MGDHKHQHFVPQMLQRYFSHDSKSIGEYLIDSNTCVSASISSTAQKPNYYKVNKTDNISIEQVYQNIETNVNPILMRLQRRDFVFTNDEIETLFLFVVAQLMRTPKAANAVGAVLDICKKKGIPEVMQEINAGIRIKDNLPMQSSLGIPIVAELLSGKDYLFVCNDTNIKFLLSDNPACLFSPVAEIANEKQIWDRMLVQEDFSGYMLYMPLGPTVGIILFDDDYYDLGEGISMNVTEDDVKTLNSLEVINATNFIMFEKGTFSPEDIKDALETRKSDKIRADQDTIYTPIDNKSFSLSRLNIDEENLVYLINRYAIEKPKKR